MASSEKQTEWFLTKIDNQGRITIDKDIRELYGFEHKEQVWAKVKKTS